jgi:hypothetical protein
MFGCLAPADSSHLRLFFSRRSAREGWQPNALLSHRSGARTPAAECPEIKPADSSHLDLFFRAGARAKAGSRMPGNKTKPAGSRG